MAVPKPAAMWPLTITAGVNDTLRVLVSATGYTATIAPATYYTPVALAAAVAAALTAAVANTWVVSVGSTGRVTISAAGLFEFLFASGGAANNRAREVLGFILADTGSITSVVAGNQFQSAWFPEEAVADDTGELDEHIRSQGVALAGSGKGLHFATRYTRRVKFDFLPPQKVYQVSEGTTYLNEAFQRMLTSGWTRFRWFPDATDLATGTDYFFDLKTAEKLQRDRLSPGSALYGLDLLFRKFV